MVGFTNSCQGELFGAASGALYPVCRTTAFQNLAAHSAVDRCSWGKISIAPEAVPT